MPVDTWAARSGRRMLALMVTGLVVIGAGVWLYGTLDDTVRHRIAYGVTVPGQVRHVSRIPVGKSYQVARVTVAYPSPGPRREATLMSLVHSGHFQEGDTVTLYVDPVHPARVTTGDGFASEGWLMEVPVPLIGIGGLLVVCPLLVRARNAWRRRRAAAR
jgi:Protein of unknown function (DUF3592)